MQKKLSDMLSILDVCQINGAKDVVIKGVTDDSRNVQAGYLFICIAGYRVDGQSYINDACKKGAVAVLTDRKVEKAPENVTIILVEDVKKAMQKIVPCFFGYPAQKMKVVGITGTNGKTTTTYMLKKIAEVSGKKTGLIGTIGALIGDEKLPMVNTTPDVVGLQTVLYKMHESNVEYVFMEVSSHALALQRIAGIEFDVAVLTNITQDHLDFHKTFASYVEAKKLLFTDLAHNKNKVGIAVLNADDKSSVAIQKDVTSKLLTYGMDSSNDVYPKKVALNAQGMQITVSTPQGEVDLQLQMTGYFNVYNVLTTVATALALGFDLSAIHDGLQGFKGVDGRFELVQVGQDFTVIVDYAHTPDGLENVLSSARVLTEQRVIVVFGCGGDRDKTKRPIMGEIAQRLADKIYVTSDNPRSELPEQIIADIQVGIGNSAKCTTIVDRKLAIESALREAKSNDIVVIAGKGHETYQILHDRTIDFDDRQVVREFLKGMA